MSFQDFINYAKSKELLVRENDKIAPELYVKHSVNKGLRDINGNGVVTGLTNISKIVSSLQFGLSILLIVASITSPRL